MTTNTAPVFDPNASYAPASTAPAVSAAPVFDPNASYAPADMSNQQTTDQQTGGAPSRVGKFFGDVSEGLGGPGSAVPGGPAETSFIKGLPSHIPGGSAETGALQTIWN